MIDRSNRSNNQDTTAHLNGCKITLRSYTFVRVPKNGATILGGCKTYGGRKTYQRLHPPVTILAPSERTSGLTRRGLLYRTNGAEKSTLWTDTGVEQNFREIWVTLVHMIFRSLGALLSGKICTDQWP